MTVAGPGTADAPARLSARETEPIRVVETLTGTEVPGAEGSRVFDLGRNIAGWPEVTVRAPAGTTVRIVPAESLKDGHAFQSISNVGGPLWDSYTTSGSGAETWHPEYGYHGFRYLELKGLPAGATVTVRGKVLHTDNTSAGDFTSSNDLVNGIHSIIRRSIEGNMMSVLTDCPSREKLGWLEQDQLVFPTLAANYDMESQLRKIVRDMADGQTPEGLITSTTPEYTALPGGYRNDSNWGGAFVLVPWQLYTTYGDQETLATYYPQMRKYVTFLEEKVSGGILDYGLGDWFTPDTTFPRAVAGTYGYWRVVDAMSRIAALLGDQDAAAGYRAKADASAKALADKYYDPAKGTFGGGGHGAEALALDMGAVPADQRDRLLGHFVASVEAADFHLNLGEISLPAAFRVLSESGHDDVVGRIATQTTSPSYGYQVLHGNTTLGESWDGGPGQSQNHFMLGAIDAWFTGRLAGIQQAPGSIGYRELLVDPALVAGLTSASGSYRTPYGTVSTSWRLNGDAYRLRLTVPAGTTAEVHVPVTSGDVAAPKGARFVRSADGERIYEVGSGDWTFTSTYREGALTPARTTRPGRPHLPVRPAGAAAFSNGPRRLPGGGAVGEAYALAGRGSSDAGSRPRAASPARRTRVVLIVAPGIPAVPVVPAATAMPRVGPTFIAVCFRPPTTPAYPGGASPTTEAVAVTMTVAKPAPSTANAAAMAAHVLPGPDRESSEMPRTTRSVPHRAVRRGP